MYICVHVPKVPIVRIVARTCPLADLQVAKECAQEEEKGYKFRGIIIFRLILVFILGIEV